MPLTLFLAPDAPTARGAAWQWLRARTDEAPLVFAATDAHESWNALGAELPSVVRALAFFENACAAHGGAAMVSGEDRTWMIAMLAHRRSWEKLDGLAGSADGIGALSNLWGDMCRAQQFELPPGAWRDEANQLFGAYRELLAEQNAFDRENAPPLFARLAGEDFDWPRNFIVDDLLDPSPALQLGLAALAKRAQNVAATLIAPGAMSEHSAIKKALDWWSSQGAEIVDVEAPVSPVAAHWLGADVGAPAPALNLTAAHTPWDEASRVARAIRAQLEDGVSAADIGLVVADLDDYAPLLRAAFGAHGVPLFIPFEAPLLLSPLVRRVLCVLENADGGWSADDLVDLFGDDTLRLSDESGALNACRLRAAMRAIGRREVGDVEQLRAVLRAKMDDYHAGETVKAALESADLDLLSEFVAESGHDGGLLDARSWQSEFESRLSRLTGHWEARADEAGALARAQLARLRSAAGEVTIRAQKWRGEEPARHTAREWLGWLRAQCARVEGAAPPAGTAIWARELGKTTVWNPSVYLLGLNEGVWPARRFSGPLGARDRETLLGLRAWESAPIARATHGLARALGESSQLSLSFAGFRDGKEVAPSPLIEDLHAVWPAANWQPLPSAAQTPPTARADWLRALAADPNAPLPPALAIMQRVQSERADVANMGIYDGDLGEAGPTLMQRWTDAHRPVQWSASSLESFARCPLRFFFERVLEIRTPDEIGAELSPRDTGTLIHEILKAFHRRFDAPLTEANAGVALQLLGELAARECADLPLPPVLREAEVRRLMGTGERPGPLRHTLRGEIERRADGGSWSAPTRPALHVGSLMDSLGRTGLEENFRDLSVGGQSVRGTVDRLDFSDDESLALVIDYKTGSAKSLPSGDDSLHFQLALYALWAREILPAETRLGLGFLLTSSGEWVKGIGQTGAFEINTNKDGTLAKKPGQPGAVMMDDAQWEAWLQRVGERVAHIAELRQTGRFHLSLQSREKAGCNYCDFASVCQRNDAVQDQRAERLQGEREVYLPSSP